MPGGKRKLKMLLTGGLQVGTSTCSTHIKDIMAGSVSITTPVFTGGTTGSTACVSGAILGLTASHTLLATPNSVCAMGGCIVFAGACPGAEAANFYFSYIAACGGEAVVGKTVTMRYLAFRT